MDSRWVQRKTDFPEVSEILFPENTEKNRTFSETSENQLSENSEKQFSEISEK